VRTPLGTLSSASHSLLLGQGRQLGRGAVKGSEASERLLGLQRGTEAKPWPPQGNSSRQTFTLSNSYLCPPEKYLENFFM